MEYTTVRTARRTVALQIKGEKIIVRAPLWMSDAEVEKFVTERRAWIEKHMKAAAERNKAHEDIPPLSSEELRKLANAAREVVSQRVRYYAPLVGVTYGNITIRCQRTRWGSCSGKGNLNFNCLLMLAPPEVLDSVVVHELCHLKEMNHSDRFYREVLRVYPEYHRWHTWLKENGDILIRRIPSANKADKPKASLV